MPKNVFSKSYHLTFLINTITYCKVLFSTFIRSIFDNQYAMTDFFYSFCAVQCRLYHPFILIGKTGKNIEPGFLRPAMV